MTEVYSWIEHPGPEGQMIGHPGPFRYYECKQCGTKLDREGGSIHTRGAEFTEN